MAGANKPEWPPLLPVGFHELDEPARRRLCVDGFPHSLTRQRIVSNVEKLIAEINQQAIPGVMWIDGSLLTEKLNPDDADLVLVIDMKGLLSLSHSQRAFFDHFRTHKYYDTHRIDNYGIVIDTSQAAGEWMYAYWLKQFGFSRAELMKGILSVKTPFLVKP